MTSYGLSPLRDTEPSTLLKLYGNLVVFASLLLCICEEEAIRSKLNNLILHECASVRMNMTSFGLFHELVVSNLRLFLVSLSCFFVHQNENFCVSLIIGTV